MNEVSPTALRFTVSGLDIGRRVLYGALLGNSGPGGPGTRGGKGQDPGHTHLLIAPTLNSSRLTRGDCFLISC